MISSVLPLLLCLLLASTPASAQAPSTVSLEDLTWTELDDSIRSGKTTIIVPIGGTEQNGRHMTLGKHNRRVQALAERIATALGDALVAPVLAYTPEGSVDPPTAHMRFPGTITMVNATFEQVLEAAARSFRLHGFRDIVFLGDHGGYQKSLQIATDRLNRAWAATPVRAHALTEYYRVAAIAYPQALRSRGFSDDEIGTHAGLADTSLALAIDPRLVRAERLQAPPSSADGVYGDPRRATAELGQLGVDAIVTQTTAAIRKATRRN